MSDTFRFILTAEDQISRVLHELTENLEHMNAPLEKLAKNFNKFAEASGISKSKEKFKELGESVNKLIEFGKKAVEAFEPLGEVLGLFSLAGLAGAVVQAGDFAHNIEIMGAKTGLAAQELQQYLIAAKAVGVGNDTLVNSFEMMTLGIAKASIGEDEMMHRLIDHLGYHGSAGLKKFEALGSAKQFDIFANAVMHAKTAEEKELIAQTAFHKGWRDLYPLLKKGSEGFAELRKEFAKDALGDEQLEKLSEFHERMEFLEAATTSLSNTIGAELAPIITPILIQMRDWIELNKQWIAETIKDKLLEVIESLKELKHWLIDADPTTGLSRWDEFAKAMIPVLHGIGDIIIALGWFTIEHPYLALTALAAYLVGPFLLSMTVSTVKIAVATGEWIASFVAAGTAAETAAATTATAMAATQTAVAGNVAAINALSFGGLLASIGTVVAAGAGILAIAGATGAATYVGSKDLAEKTNGRVIGVNPMTGEPTGSFDENDPTIPPVERGEVKLPQIPLAPVPEPYNPAEAPAIGMPDGGRAANRRLTAPTLPTALPPISLQAFPTIQPPEMTTLPTGESTPLPAPDAVPNQPTPVTPVITLPQLPQMPVPPTTEPTNPDQPKQPVLGLPQLPNLPKVPEMAEADAVPADVAGTQALGDSISSSLSSIWNDLFGRSKNSQADQPTEQKKSEVSVTVDFSNVPSGTDVDVSQSGHPVEVTKNVGVNTSSILGGHP